MLPAMSRHKALQSPQSSQNAVAFAIVLHTTPNISHIVAAAHMRHHDSLSIRRVVDQQRDAWATEEFHQCKEIPYHGPAIL
jgi:multisubunit Na+/H+ antiporter MnhG subunit